MTTPAPALDERAATPRFALGVCLLLGLGVRAALLVLAGDIELQSDEANYVYSALAWKHFGVYFDHYRFLWPPGYSAYLAGCLSLFGENGLQAARIGQVLASLCIGLSVGLLGQRLAGPRAAVTATLAWALYLPLAAFTHLLWNETLFLALFLPGLLQLVALAQEPPDRAVDRRVLAAGLCLAGALYVKEAPLYLLPVLAALLPLTAARGMRTEALRRATGVLLVVTAAVLPWTLRNLDVYDRPIPLGSSLGENSFNGLNANYRNFDLVALQSERSRRGSEPLAPRTLLTAQPEGAEAWQRAEELDSLPARLAENTRRGLGFASAHPGWFLRTRLQKLADAATPLSFLPRHLALGHYHGALARAPWRRPIALATLGLPLVLLALGGLGLLLALPPGRARWLLWATASYFVATLLLVSMSRFRLPLIPLLCVGLGCLVSRPPRGVRARWIGACWLLLLGLTLWLHWPVLTDVLPMILGGASV